MTKEIEDALLLFLTADDRNFIEFPAESQDQFQEATELLRKEGLVTVTIMEEDGINITASLTENGLSEIHKIREKRNV
ncbi:hypothetical protein L0657_26815 [Dyadobacter sp. CY345]|uniref:hypothetical protein n=1 Tax=Dyadobacter sp. CY345 TaxID=2909335 RepID=UPI001F357499|nr:hypothetical protein [Dyadobacter sp. CY345]MCF2447597.1 hypothetical protein [Dyadobacter sp. CY345]